MKYSVLGPTGVRVSRVCVPRPLSAWPRVRRMLTASWRRHWIWASTSSTRRTFTVRPPRSTAPVHRPPRSASLRRRSSGRALTGRRDDVVLATKSGERRFDPDAGPSRRYIIKQVEQSLRLLRTDHIDLYYAHFPDPATPLEQTLAVYDDLIRQGKLRYVALSNHPAWQLTEALWIADARRMVSAPVGAQVMYSLLDRSAEAELAAACVRFGLSIVPYAPLHGGSWPTSRSWTERSQATNDTAAPGFSEAEIAVAREVDRLAREWGMEMYQVSLAWLLSRPAVASVIVGAETIDDLRANASAADVELTPEQLDAVSALTADMARRCRT